MKKAKKAIIEKINPGGREKSCWFYIFCMHEEDTGGIHKIYFDKKGKFIGIIANPVGIYGDNRPNMISWLKRCIKDIKKYPALTAEEFKILTTTKK